MFRVQSIAKLQQSGNILTLAAIFRNQMNLLFTYYCFLFSIWAYEKMCDFQGYFSINLQNLKLYFSGLSRSWNLQEKIPKFLGGVGTLQYVIQQLYQLSADKLCSHRRYLRPSEL